MGPAMANKKQRAKQAHARRTGPTGGGAAQSARDKAAGGGSPKASYRVAGRGRSVTAAGAAGLPDGERFIDGQKLCSLLSIDLDKVT